MWLEERVLQLERKLAVGGCCSGGWLAGEQPPEIKKEMEQRGLLVADKGREWVCCDWSCGFDDEGRSSELRLVRG